MRRQSNTSACLPVIPYQQCPAKTWTTATGEVQLGRLVLEHCLTVGRVAEQLIKLYPQLLAEKLFPKGSPLVAAAHDVGKISPTFIAKLLGNCTQTPSLSVDLAQVSPDLEGRWGGHAGVSQLTAQALNLGKYIPEILGQHHGFTPPIATYCANDQSFGGADWQQNRCDFLDELSRQLGMTWPKVESDAQARLLAGLTSVADWIGSGIWFDDPAEPWEPNIERALQDAGWYSPTYQQGLSFEEVFGFRPRLVQQQLIDAVQGPGVYVLEAPMGLGKTEAALYAAYQQLAKGEASGIYFALPTQLTSNKIYDRFNTFLRHILCDDSPLHSRLLHSGAWLVDTAMGEEGEPGRSWFSSAKRGLLAPFAVGTLDQALMAAMNVKHGFVRAFGLAGKVVVLDEVHTYDAYTSTLLDALIELLRQLECTVIILSATLSQSRRIQLLKTPLNSKAYPLITAIAAGDSPQELPVATQPTGTVTIKLASNTNDAVEAIEESLIRAEQGQQVLWIENTVAEAQARYLQLAARAEEIGVACGLLHSRFTPQHRQTLEEKWVNLFGKAGWSVRQQQGRILIGTQVLEQSLDIDADFLISQFAPTDMLLQRLGRLWRHSDTPRNFKAQRECWLLAPPLEDAIATPYSAFGKSASIYAPYILCRSLEVWQSVNNVNLPYDIRRLIEETYCGREESVQMQRWLYELEEGTPRRKGCKALAQLAQIGLATSGKTLPESQAQTRYSELESMDVLLLRNIEPLSAGGSRLTLLDGTYITLPASRPVANERKAWRKLSARLMTQVIKVTPDNAPLPVALDTLRKLGLHHCIYVGNPAEDEALLRIALVDDTSYLSGLYGAALHDSKILTYEDDQGYCVRKAEREGGEA